MIGTEWFGYRGKWHIATLDDPAKAECGLTMTKPPSTITSTAEDPWPPAPCMSCAVRAQERFMVEEPLEDALARGFERVAPSEGE